MTDRQRVAPRGDSVYVDAGDVRLHALRYGESGPDLLLLPGLTCPAVTLEFLAVELARDHRVVTADFRGRGLSDAPATGYGLPDYAGDVLALIDGLGLGRPLVVGQALGARIAPAFDALYPGRASAIVLIDPPLTGPDTEPYPTPLASFLEQIREVGGPDAFDRVRTRMPGWTDEQVRTRADWLDTCAEHAIAETHDNFHREDLMAYIARMSVPALFVYGEHSHAVSPQTLAVLRAANPAVEQFMVAGAGHLVPFDDLDATLRAIRSFTRP
jgi:N-formylmaleamate deformylase